MPQNTPQANLADTNDWWRSFHVIEMADLFLDRPQAQVDQTTDFLMKTLELNSGDHVFDQCCGIGTVALNFARRGLNATGVDLCQIYIDRAIQTTQEQSLACNFSCDDAFTFSPAESCDAAFNWYSSFGYAKDDNRNQSMLQRAFDCLKPSGLYALDIPNLPSLLRGFQHHIVKAGQSNGREVTCVRNSNINLEQGLLEQTWQWFAEGRSVDRRRSALRLYLPHQVREMLLRVGFETIQQLGGIDGQPLSIDSPRLILLARKPA